MAKQLIVACAALLLLGAIAATPLTKQKTTMEQIMDELSKLERELPKNTSLVPKVSNNASEQKTLPIEEIACRALKSLHHLSNLSEKSQCEPLKRYLLFFSKGVICTVDPEKRHDLHSFVLKLRSVFQEHYAQSP